MGIDVAWKKYLQEEYPNCFYEFLPDGVIPTSAIDDYTTRSFGFVPYAKSFNDIIRASNRLIVSNVPYLKKYVILFDEFSPPNKRVKQTKLKFPPYTIDEIKQKGIFVPNGNFPDQPEKLLTTHVLKRDLYRLMSNEMRHPNFKNEEPTCPPCDCTVIIDGVPDGSSRGSLIYKFAKHYPTRTQNYDTKNFSVLPTSGELGESDLKVPFYISRCEEGETILVINSDGDLWPILMLNMRDWIDPLTGNIKYEIWLYNKKKDIKPVNELYEGSSGPPKKKQKKKETEQKHFDRDDPINFLRENNDSQFEGKKDQEEAPKKNLIYINGLFRSILKRFKSKYNIDQGIVALALIYLSHENDFVDKMPGLGPAAIWKAFTKGEGYKILSGSPLQTIQMVNLPKPKVVTKDDIFDVDSVYVGKPKLKDIHPKEIVYDFDYAFVGQPSRKHRILLNENRIKLWLRFIIQYHIKGKPKYSGDIENVVQLTTSLKEKMGTKPFTNRTPVIPTPDELNCRARQMLWCLEYMSNGGKIISGQRNFPNPLEVDMNGTSIWGWIFNEKTEKVEAAKKVIHI
jgi:hypothetical protein